MRRAGIFLPVFIAAALMAQQTSQPLLVRNVFFKPVSTRSEPLKFDVAAITTALKSKGIDFAESKYDPSSVDKADDVIRDLYASEGQSVRVEHSVTGVTPRSVEIRFEIIQLCNCP